MILFAGGVRSGKSALAQKWTENSSPERLYLATCQPLDDEMQKRIALHRECRDSSWACVEEAHAPLAALRKFLDTRPGFRGAILLDSLDMLVANMLARNATGEEIRIQTGRMLRDLAQLPFPCAIVTVECGMGFVPTNPLARQFGDLVGMVNQTAAAVSDTAVLVHCGLPLLLKGTMPACLS